MAQTVKYLPAGDAWFDPGSGRSPGEGNGNSIPQTEEMPWTIFVFYLDFMPFKFNISVDMAEFKPIIILFHFIPSGIEPVSICIIPTN